MLINLISNLIVAYFVFCKIPGHITTFMYDTYSVLYLDYVVSKHSEWMPPDVILDDVKEELNTHLRRYQFGFILSFIVLILYLLFSIEIMMSMYTFMHPMI